MKRIDSFTWSPPALSAFQSKKVAIIGGTGGIGRAFAQLLAAHGAQVTVVGRKFQDAGAAGIDFIQADLSRMSEARRVAETLQAETLDLVVFTTGIMAGPKREVTSDGIERDLVGTLRAGFTAGRQPSSRAMPSAARYLELVRYVLEEMARPERFERPTLRFVV